MNRYILFIWLTASVLLAMCPKAAFGDVSANEQDAAVSMTITKLQINDQTLELTYKIKNDSDHDVWILDNISNYIEPNYEVYLSEDEQSLQIRRCLDVPTALEWYVLPYGRYVLLRSGQERTESVSFAVPVAPRRVFSGESGTSDHARRLVLEIGFYNEDLPKLIRDIIEMAEKLNCARLELRECSTAFFIRYFEGIWIAQWLFGGLSQFEEYTYKEGSEEIEIPYTWQNFSGEQALRATIDGISIPYKSNYPLFIDKPPQNETEPDGVTIALTGFDVNDTTLELCYKIKNNSDHDVWICDSKDTHPALSDIEVFMAKDNQTLVIRRRFDLTPAIYLELPLPIGRYVRLRAGEELVEFLSLRMPASPNRSFEAETGMAEYARRLVLEIGFYDEDLRGLILRIVDVANKLDCTAPVIPPLDIDDIDVRDRYFEGLLIARTFNSTNWPYFKESIEDGGDEIFMPLMGQIFNTEQVLWIMLDGVSIPYSKWAPLTDHN